MPRQRFTPEQIIGKLREVEVVHQSEIQRPLTHYPHIMKISYKMKIDENRRQNIEIGPRSICAIWPNKHRNPRRALIRERNDSRASAMLFISVARPDFRRSFTGGGQ